MDGVGAQPRKEGVTMLDNITIGDAVAAVVAIGAAAGVILSWAAPVGKWRKRLEQVERTNETMCNSFRAMGMCMIALLDHEISGENIDKVRDARDTLQRELFTVPQK